MLDWESRFIKQLVQQESHRERYTAFRQSIHQLTKVNDFLVSLAKKDELLRLSAVDIEVSRSKEAELKSKMTEFNHPRISELVSQVESLKLEQQELYKNNFTNAQRILSLIDSSKVDSDKIALLNTERSDLANKVKILERRNADERATIKEKDAIIEILRDESAANLLELSQMEARLRGLEQEITTLKEENQVLIERWMAKTASDVNQMNEANDFVNTYSKINARALKSKATIASRVFSMFQSPTVEEVTTEPSITMSTLPSKFYRLFKNNHDEDINCIAINSAGTVLATGGNDRKVILYSVASGQARASLGGLLKGVTSLTFSPNDELILATSNDSSLKIWDVERKIAVHTFTSHTNNVYGARFLGPTSVVSGSHDRTIKVWDLKRGQCVKTIFTLSSCTDVTPLNYSGTLIASGHFDNQLRVWDSKSGACIREVSAIHSQQITCVQVSPDERFVMTTSKDNTIKVLDVRMFNTVATLAAPGFKTACNWAKSCYSSDGAYIASGSADGNVYVWKDGLLASVLSKHGSSVVGVAWSKEENSHLFSVADREKSIVEWEP